MVSRSHRAIARAVRLAPCAALVVLGSCDTRRPLEPAASPLENTAVANDQMIARPEARRAGDHGPAPASQEPSMPQPDATPAPPPVSVPAGPPAAPPAKPPAAPPRRVILPSPIQPPAEVDPVQPYPGDEVPR